MAAIAPTLSWATSRTDFEIPVPDTKGATVMMQVRICRPNDTDTFAAVVINHGSPTNAAARLKMTLSSCDSEVAKWFLARDYAVVFPLRLGYGATGGPWTEAYGSCDNPDFYRAGLETARQIKRVVDHLDKVPRIDAENTLVVGHSAGGWGTIAYDSINHPHVVGFINMAGGRGGHYQNKDNNNCGADALVAAAKKFGRTASTPMLWIYAENDTFFAPELAQRLRKAFTHAGGTLTFEAADSFGEDGHQLFPSLGGSRIWGPIVADYLDSLQ